MVFLDYSLWPSTYEVSPVLNDNSWVTISKVASANEGENYWSVGDCKQVTLNGTVSKLKLSNYSIYAFIIGFNHNSSREGASRIHFQLGKTALTGGRDICLISGYDNDSDFYMNSNGSNSGGWNSSYMRNTICGTNLSSYSGTFIAVIPASLRSVLKSVTKYTNNDGYSSSSSSVTATTDYFFLLSEREIFGKVIFGNAYEAHYQHQYAYYAVGNSKVKYRHDNINTDIQWWTRSPQADSHRNFVRVISPGDVSIVGAKYSIGVAPGFCV